jgi:tripartite-type tricarboxylate transporter receptor subunit TctC
MSYRFLATLVVIIVAPIAQAQDYPNRPVRVLVPQPAGSTPDMVTRLVTPGLSSLLGQQFVVDNRGGAGGMIGTDIGAKATPDGYTLVVGTPGTLTIMPHVQRSVPYKTLRDFSPIGLISVGQYLLVAHPALSAKSAKELIALAKQQPGKLNYASAGNGATNHLAMETFKSMAGVDITHVPYKGAPQAVADLIGGQVDISLLSIGPLLPHIKAGRLKVLAVSGAKRSSQFPDVPTITESGVPGYEAITWFGMLVPAKTPANIQARLSEALRKVLNDPETRTRFARQGAEIAETTPRQFEALLRKETESYGKAVKASGMKID